MPRRVGIKIDDKFWEGVATMWEQRQAGATLVSLAKTWGTSSQNVAYLLRSKYGTSDFTSICAMPECGKSFPTKIAHTRHCCRKHGKVMAGRRESGIEAVQRPCMLPECEVLVWTTQPLGGKPSGCYCMKNHSTLHSMRRLSGYYDRLLMPGVEACEVCGEQFVLDEHHEVFVLKRGKGAWSEEGPLHKLCPTHHYQIHRGMAKYENGKFVNLVPVLQEALARKQEMFERYFG